MNDTYNKKLVPNAQTLRKKMTKEERHLWYDFIKEMPVMVHRQKVIGPYIVDFYNAAAKLVIEIDGSQHYEEEGQKADYQRDMYLESLGISVQRYANSDANRNFDAACQDIWHKVFSTAIKPSPRGEALSPYIQP